MNEINRIVKFYHEMDWELQKAALAIVVRVEGSSYRRTGARMMVSSDGSWMGGISGGCLEGDALRKALFAIHSGRPNLVTYDTTLEDGTQIGVGLGCQGIIDVLFLPIDPANKFNPLLVLERAIADRIVKTVVTIIEGSVPWLNESMRCFIYEAFPLPLPQDLGSAIQVVKSSGKAQMVTRQDDKGGMVKLFIEPILPPVKLLICGGNYDIYPLINLSKILGWSVEVIAKAAKLKPETFEMVDAIHPPGEVPKELDAWTAVLLMAHDFQTDKVNLQEYLQTNVGYIGLLGPKNRSERILKELGLYSSFDGGRIDKRLYFPVGLDIGASNPEEISIAIISEIIAFFAGRKGGFLKDRVGPIYT